MSAENTPVQTRHITSESPGGVDTGTVRDALSHVRATIRTEWRDNYRQMSQNRFDPLRDGAPGVVTETHQLIVVAATDEQWQAVRDAAVRHGADRDAVYAAQAAMYAAADEICSDPVENWGEFSPLVMWHPRIHEYRDVGLSLQQARAAVLDDAGLQVSRPDADRDGDPDETVDGRMGCAPGTARRHLQRVREKVRDAETLVRMRHDGDMNEA